MTPQDESAPRSGSVSTPLSFRIEQALRLGIEYCYSPDLARDFAIAYESGAESVIEADAGEAKLKEKFGEDFNLQRFRRGVKAYRTELLRQAAANIPNRSGWEAELIRKSTENGPGPVVPCEANAILYFRHHEDWRGKLAWNEFSGELAILDDLPEPVSAKKGEQMRDHHDTLFQVWLQQQTREARWAIDCVRRSIDCCAKENSFNPIHDYLHSLPPWDGVARLPTWLQTYCAAGPAESDDSPESQRISEFISAIGERWWISMIARAFRPGCKVHHVLVLEGAKGIGKTSLVEILFDKYYAFITGDVTTKDNQQLLSAGVWGILMDELDVLGKSAMRAVKQWVTQDHEKFRPVWGHRHETRPRRCVFIATVNGSEWAMEEDRRWWPVHCGSAFDLDSLRRDRDLLMSEALHKYRTGQRWHFDPAEDAALIATAKQEQAARVPDEVLQEDVINAAVSVCEKSAGNRYGSASVSEILAEMKIPIERRQSLQSTVGRCLKRAGWKLYQPRVSGEQVRRWRSYELYPLIRQ
jgi:putative DNA primase/helicase